MAKQFRWDEIGNPMWADAALAVVVRDHTPGALGPATWALRPKREELAQSCRLDHLFKARPETGKCR